MEYVLGPVIALAIGFTVGNRKFKQHTQQIEEIEQRLELVQKSEEELPKKVMATVLPIAKAVNRLNTEVGLKWRK